MDKVNTELSSLKLYGRLLTYVLPYIPLFLISILGFAIYSGSQVAATEWLKRVIDYVNSPEGDLRLVLPLVLIVIALVRGLGFFVGNYLLSSISNRLVHNLRTELFEKLTVLPSSYYDQHSSGHLISRITFNVMQVTGAATNALKILIREGLLVIGLITYLMFLNWKLALFAILMIPLAFGIRSASPSTFFAEEDVSFTQALRDAFGLRDFWLLSLGFFVCGFQVVFIAVHLPAFLMDKGVGDGVAMTVLALIGLVNIAGTYYAGLWGGRHRKPMLLTWIYLGRAAVISAFVLLPITSTTAYIFGALMGLFWLSTIPLTNGVVASVWGIKHMSMLGGVVFFGHQLGSFAGGWMGGWLHDRTGSYDIAWGFTIALSLIAAVLNWPITERTLAQRRTQA